MIKRSISILLPLLLLCLIFGCSSKAEQLQQPVSFFYPEKAQEDGSIFNVIRSEEREGSAFGDDLHLLLVSYLSGPRDTALYSPFPAQLKLIEATCYEGTVTLLFDESFGALSGLDRTIACACVSQTCLAFTGADSVRIFAENTLFNGGESIEISRESILTQDNTPILEP